ncbi:MAG: hypothetical protein H8E27_04370 [Verrucomicrobia subdivision 3 bacterium]|nr:hypothetical protein [Limisphaerales bacterium]
MNLIEVFSIKMPVTAMLSQSRFLGENPDIFHKTEFGERLYNLGKIEEFVDPDNQLIKLEASIFFDTFEYWLDSNKVR